MCRTVADWGLDYRLNRTRAKGFNGSGIERANLDAHVELKLTTRFPLYEFIGDHIYGAVSINHQKP